MNVFESMLISFIFILFPLTIYLLAELVTTTLNNKKEELFIDIALVSSTYLLIKYGTIKFDSIPFILLNIPLLIAYTKKRNITIVLLSFTLIFYYYTYFSIPIYLVSIEYLLYYIIYCLLQTKKNCILLDIFLKLKTFFLFIWIYVTPKLFINNDHKFVILLSLMIILILGYQFTMLLFLKTEDVISMHKMINKAEEDKDMYQSLFKITHEIKNPIAVCKGYLDMFDTNNRDHPRKYIPILKSEINRLLVLLEDFLSVNRIKIEKDVMDIDMLIEDVVKNFKPILEEKNIDIDYCSRNEVFIEGDYNRIKQVFVNLIKNSIESVECSGKIKIRYRVVKNMIYVHIEDNGIGMTREELSKLNEPFYTTKSRGTGLGVYLSREIIKAHDGSIKYTSKKDKGTTVTIKIPRGDFKLNY